MRPLGRATVCHPLRGLMALPGDPTWGSAALHPRLYAIACSAGWVTFISPNSKVET
jgi:hypothetical protein